MAMNHVPRTEELSAYLDDLLDAKEKAELEGHIKSCALCRDELQELRATVALLKALPAVRPPRSFTLDPALVAPRRSRWLPTLRWASAALSLLLMLTIGLDLSNIGQADLSNRAEQAAGTSEEGFFAPVGVVATTATTAAAPPLDDPNRTTLNSAAATSAPVPATATAAALPPGAEPGSERAVPTQAADTAGDEVVEAEATGLPTFAAQATLAPPAEATATAAEVAAAEPTATAFVVVDEGPSVDWGEENGDGAIPSTAGGMEPEATEWFTRQDGSPYTLTSTDQLHSTGNLAYESNKMNGENSGAATPGGDVAGGALGEVDGLAADGDAGGTVAPPPQEPSAGAQAWLRAFEILVGALLAVSLVALAVLSRRTS